MCSQVLPTSFLKVIEFSDSNIEHFLGHIISLIHPNYLSNQIIRHR